jgi:hypothetical protein
MWIEIFLTHEPIARPQAWNVPFDLETGSLVEFFGMVRETEGDTKIPGLRYEAYASMAEKVMREKIALLEKKHPCQAVRIVHRLGHVRSTSESSHAIAGRVFVSFRNSWTNSSGTYLSGNRRCLKCPKCPIFLGHLGHAGHLGLPHP